MAYNEFSISLVRQRFPEYFINEQAKLFDDLEPVKISAGLRSHLEKYLPRAIAINTEKARSELIITPILLEVRERVNAGFFSGSYFNVDSERGLVGRCDYILTETDSLYEIEAPVLIVVEAKNENIKSGLGQCMSEMIAADIVNQRAKMPRPIMGVVTTGEEWKFLVVKQETIKIDLNQYYINEIDKVVAHLSSFFPK